MVLLRLFDYQGALTVRYHRLRSFYRRRLFAAYSVFGNGQNRTPGTAYRQTECTGCPHGVLPKDSPAPILPQRAGDLHIKALSLSKNQIKGKKEVEK